MRRSRTSIHPRGPPALADDQFTPQFYRDTVAPLVSDAARLDRMARASAAHGVRDAAQVMARLTLDSARR